MTQLPTLTVVLAHMGRTPLGYSTDRRKPLQFVVPGEVIGNEL